MLLPLTVHATYNIRLQSHTSIAQHTKQPLHSSGPSLPCAAVRPSSQVMIWWNRAHLLLRTACVSS